MSRPDPVTRDISPCKDCKDRHHACHGSCDRYKEWKQRLEQLKYERREYDRTRYNKYKRD